MKRFHFRLDRLLRLKQQKERLAELKQLQARVLFEAAEREVQTLLERLSEMAATIEGRVGQPVEAMVWLAQYQHMTQLRKAIDTAETKAARAKAILDETNRSRRKAAADVDALDFLRRKQWQQHREEAARAEQDRLDEMCLNRWRGQTEAPAQSGTDGEVIIR